jgi:hypothetical protein
MSVEERLCLAVLVILALVLAYQAGVTLVMMMTSPLG